MFLLGLWFLTTLLVARFLGKTEFGIYIFCITLIKLFSTFIGDTLDLAVLRRAPVYLRVDRSLGLGLLRSSFWVRALAGVAAAFFVIACSSWLAQTFLNSAELSELMILAATGIVGELLARAALVYFQAATDFRNFIILEGTLQFGRISLIGLLILLDGLTAEDALSIYVSVPYAVFALALLIAPSDLFKPAPSARRELSDLLHFSKWMLLALATAALSERMETFLVGYFLTPADIGIYGAALLLTMIPEFLEGSIGTVLIPRVAQMHAQGRISELHTWYMKRSIPACILMIAGIFLFGDWFATAFLSERFAAAGPIFKAQMVGAMFWLALAPVPSALIAFVSARRLLGINLVGLGARFAVGISVIPSVGIIGAGYIFLGVRIGMTLVVLWVGRNLAKPRLHDGLCAGAAPFGNPLVVPAAEGKRSP